MAAASEDTEDFAAGWIGEGTENGVALPAVTCNHTILLNGNQMVSECQ
jgi:hypothetical protein